MTRTSLLQRGIDLLCRFSVKYPALLLLIFAFVTLPPALVQLKKIKLNTNLDRLLPKTSPAALWKEKLKKAIGDGGYFTFLVEGTDPKELKAAVLFARERVKNLPAVSSVEYRYPLTFIEKFRYLLVSSPDLDKIYDWLIGLESELSPAGLDLFSDDVEGKESYGSKEEKKYLNRQLEQYGNLPEFHQSKDGTVMGFFIRPLKGVTNLGATRALFQELQNIATDASARFSLWTGVSGSLRNKVDEYDLILSDLKRSGLIASTLILLTLLWSFRSLLVVPVLLFPLLFGLVWAFSLVPHLVGDLNTITSFILLVLFGMGIDYSIHLTKHFQLMLKNKTPEEALLHTCQTTGVSVGISAGTTAFSLLILSVSDFRGFSEFGVVGGVTIFMVLLSMFFLMPACLILGERVGFIKPLSNSVHSSRFFLLTSKKARLLVICLITASSALIATRFSFDYDFSNLKATVPGSEAVKEKHRKVYTTSMSPAALYVAENVESLDAVLSTLESRMSEKESRIGRLTSIRDFTPKSDEVRKRFELIADIQDQVQGRWTRHIPDDEQKNQVRSLKEWNPPDAAPEIGEIPSILKNRYMTHDDSGRFVLGVYPNVERKNGKNAIAFTEELYETKLPKGVQGPVGETPIFAEILLLVTAEAPLLTSLSFLGTLLLIFFNRRSIRETGWILLPLVFGFILTLGLMGAISFKLNFFNIVVLPTLLGMGVDNGVHFYCRWKQCRNTKTTLTEL
ncbi:MAG: RND family transporter, partial [Nitrospinota bacterium]